MPDLPLLSKYNVPVPRYTSYPTVPYWQEGLDVGRWKHHFQEAFGKGNDGGISLYIHLPFCESLCTYCGCNKKITTNHSVEEVYLEAVLQEWRLYRELMETPPVIREIHLGGGTPTFFSPANLQRLIHGIMHQSRLHSQYEFSIEGHPNNTTKAHLETLYSLGFSRISYGVQDNDPEVQRVINRIQPFENVQRATEWARAAGFTSINFDLIYGLPRQTAESMERTIAQTVSLKPDRVAFYSYAHVPWTSRGQRLFDETDLPDAALKMRLYRLGKQRFTEAGYTDIGMDHFALPGDELFKAFQEGYLHRNFMGYTTQHSALQVGLGVSAISDLGTAFGQNAKALHDYYRHIEAGELAVQKGYFLNAEDRAFRRYILDLICQGRTGLHREHCDVLVPYTFPVLAELEADGLVDWNEDMVRVTEKGHGFLRNICRAFDLHLLRGQGTAQPQFSKAI